MHNQTKRKRNKIKGREKELELLYQVEHQLYSNHVSLKWSYERLKEYQSLLIQNQATPLGCHQNS